MINRTPFIIAEMSGNHGGSLLRALDIIVAAKRCGADSVKIQLYEPEDLDDPANNEIYEKSKIPREWVPHLFNAARAVGISLFSSVFSASGVQFLKQFDCPAYKIASPESTRLKVEAYRSIRDALSYINRPLIASTGRADRNSIRCERNDYLLYCVAGYPANVTDDDIAFMSEGNFDGFSDHSNDIKTPLAMIGAGAKIIEKHFKLDDDCIDAVFSLNPEQMKLLCDIAHK